MRLAFISTYLPQRCGIATYTSYLVDALLQVEPHVRIKVIAENLASAVETDRLTVLPVWSRKEDYVPTILEHLEDVDCLHIQHEYSIYGFDDRLPRLLDSVPADIKKILTIHCIRPAQFSERAAIDENFAYTIAKRADRIILHLEAQKAILVRLGIEANKICIIPHGTLITDEDKLNSREKFNLPKDAKIVLMFGFVKPHKCYEVAIKALTHILKKRRDVYIFIAGTVAPTASEREKQYVEYIRDMIDKLDVTDNVIFPNRFFPDEDVPYLMGASDIVLFHYYEEDRSSSGAFHLAIGAGKPIIATRIPKFEELKNISDELLILPYNSEGLAQVILRLLEDDTFRDYVINKTYEYRERTSWKAVAKQHMEVYRDATSW